MPVFFISDLNVFSLCPFCGTLSILHESLCKQSATSPLGKIAFEILK